MKILWIWKNGNFAELQLRQNFSYDRRFKQTEIIKKKNTHEAQKVKVQGNFKMNDA